eukprot:7385082-Prymnesium_polylepis.1
MGGCCPILRQRLVVIVRQGGCSCIVVRTQELQRKLQLIEVRFRLQLITPGCCCTHEALLGTGQLHVLMLDYGTGRSPREIMVSFILCQLCAADKAQKPR